MAIPKVIRGRTELRVPYGAKQIARFAHPFAGPGNYQTVGQAVLADGLDVPTGDLTAHLLHAAYCVPAVSEEPEFAEVRQNMNDAWFWPHQTNLWTPEGVYVRQDPEAKGLALEMDAETLDSMLKGGTTQKGVRFSKDRTVRFAPIDTYKGGEQSADDFANNGFVIASFGVKGAKKLAEVAGTFPNEPYVFVLEASEPTKRLSAVDDDGGRLDFGGNNFEDNRNGYASGVLKSAPKAPRKV